MWKAGHRKKKGHILVTTEQINMFFSAPKKIKTRRSLTEEMPVGCEKNPKLIVESH